MFEIGQTYRGEKVPKKTKWIYSMSGAGRDAAYFIVATVLLTFLLDGGILSSSYKEYMAMNGVLTGLIIAYRFLDAIIDPIMGVIIEKTHFKLGKYKPWILIGSATNTICILALFCAPTAISWCHGWAYVAWFAVFYLLWGITFSINDIAFWGMLPSMSSDERERSKVTALLLIACYAGTFLASILIPILKDVPSIGTNAYWIMGIVIGALFLIGQACVFLFCKEHYRDLEAEKNKPQVKFKDMITVFKNNDQVRVMMFTIFIYFLATSVFSALMQNIFYVTIGYSAGLKMMTAFNAVNNICMILPCFIAPYLCKKFAMKDIFKISYGVMIVGLILFFFYGAPIGGGTLGSTTSFISPSPTINGQLNPVYAVLYCIITAMIFLGQGLAYNVLVVMVNNCIEYNDYKFGERKEAIISSLKPLTTKLSSSLQQLVSFLTLLITGVADIMAKINNINSPEYKKEHTAEQITQELEKVCADASTTQMWTMKVFCVIIPIILAMLCWFIVVKFYKIDEKSYQQMCEAIKKRDSGVK